jgi:hypothetical protein
MSTMLRRSNLERGLVQLSARAARLAEVTMTVLDAMLNPGRIIAEVEQMRRLLNQAARIEATDPARAAQLREQAARILS